MLTGWKEYKGVWYYLKESGAMASSEWVDGYWLNSNGSWTYKPRMNWKRNACGWWYEDTAGWYPKNQWQYIDGKWYLFDRKGYMLTGW